MERLTEWDEFGNADIIGVNAKQEVIELYEIVEGISRDRLREICEAEQDGRLVVLPCKPGGFWLRDGRRYCVTHVSIGESGITYVHYFEDGNGKLLRCNSRYFVEHFTREEADAALEKQEGAEHERD